MADRRVFQSRLLREGSYDPVSRKMHLTFRGGEVYTGSDVPPSLWEGLKQSGRPGVFFHSTLRPLIRFSKEDS